MWTLCGHSSWLDLCVLNGIQQGSQLRMNTRNAYEMCVWNMDIILNSMINAVGRVYENCKKNTKTETNTQWAFKTIAYTSQLQIWNLKCNCWLDGKKNRVLIQRPEWALELKVPTIGPRTSIRHASVRYLVNFYLVRPIKGGGAPTLDLSIHA